MKFRVLLLILGEIFRVNNNFCLGLSKGQAMSQKIGC